MNARRTHIQEKNNLGNKSCIGICLNSCFLSIPSILWNINGINYIGISFMVLSEKSLVCAHGIDLKVELKKKKRTKKDTEHVRCLIL